MADTYLSNLTSQMAWAEIVALSSEEKAVEAGWNACLQTVYEKDGPMGAKAATALPMPTTRRPSERTDTLAVANPQRPRELSPVSVAYTEFMDELIMDKEEWDQITASGKAQAKVDECYEAIYSRVVYDFTLRIGAANATTYMTCRDGDNTLSAIAANAHPTLVSGTTVDNLHAYALTTDNVRIMMGLLANQKKVNGEPGFFKHGQCLIAGDWGELYRITQSELASGANDENAAKLLTAIHLPELSTTTGGIWAVTSRPHEYGLRIEWAYGRRPYVKAPVLDEYNRVKIVFGAKYAFLCPSYSGTQFSVIP